MPYCIHHFHPSGYSFANLKAALPRGLSFHCLLLKIELVFENSATENFEMINGSWTASLLGQCFHPAVSVYKEVRMRSDFTEVTPGMVPVCLDCSCPGHGVGGCQAKQAAQPRVYYSTFAEYSLSSLVT